MKEHRPHPRRKILLATDHRALVLESVATSPKPPTGNQVCQDCVTPEDFSSKNVLTMLDTLRREGLIGMNENKTHFLTKAGLHYLTNGRFDKALPEYAERPKSRRKKQHDI